MVGPRYAGLAMFLLLVSSAGHSKAPCIATASVVPPEAFVGQQVLYVLRIEQRRDVARVRFQPPLSFPGMRSEWLPTVRLPDPDEGARAYQERRALHPGHPGALRLPEAGLLCETPAGSHLVRIPSIDLQVWPVPTAGRPDNWNGLVGGVVLEWSLLPEHVALGETARLSVRVDGKGMLWRVDPGVEEMLDPGDADIFILETDEQRDKGRSLSVRTYRRYDVVPRRTGELVFPGLRIASFDPTSERFEQHVLPDLALRVSAGKPNPNRPVEDPSPRIALEDAVDDVESPGSVWHSRHFIGGVALAALLGVGVLVLRSRAVRPRDPMILCRRMHNETTGLLDRGDTIGAASGLARCLTILAENRSDAGDPFSGQGAAAHSREVALLADRLERARFSGPVDEQELRAVAAELGALLVTDRSADC